MTLLTVGHGTLSTDDFVTLVCDAGIGTVVDIRHYPGSRRHPHFGRDAMESWLPQAGVAYQWLVALGGRRPVRPDSPHTALRNDSFRGYADHMETAEFSAGLDALGATAAAAGGATAVMCAESVWWRCHRRLASDYLVAVRGTEVTHLMHDGRLRPHPLTDGVRVDGDRLVYDVGTTEALPLTTGEDTHAD